ncbi:MAG: hypothetical protein LBT81_05710 [Helicobacteraceae bacterium]|jgi:chromosome segregation ATPase|nr:hypothetical protein [Helicobacteraceae bacterium]
MKLDPDEYTALRKFFEEKERLEQEGYELRKAERQAELERQKKELALRKAEQLEHRKKDIALNIEGLKSEIRKLEAELASLENVS